MMVRFWWMVLALAAYEGHARFSCELPNGNALSFEMNAEAYEFTLKEKNVQGSNAAALLGKADDQVYTFNAQVGYEDLDLANGGRRCHTNSLTPYAVNCTHYFGKGQSGTITDLALGTATTVPIEYFVFNTELIEEKFLVGPDTLEGQSKLRVSLVIVTRAHPGASTRSTQSSFEVPLDACKEANSP
jgi:hypothetical protein